MTITNDRRVLYPNMTENEIEAIDEAHKEVVWTLLRFGIKTTGDDRAENLVGAIARYIKDCRS